ncbi:MAG: glycosyltransferase [Nitrospirae bacterium]|nr:glycosyltransferase [Nitrospirota bacterium]
MKYKVSRFMETNLLRKADAVFTICQGLRRDIISRDIPADKITVIPNCVEADLFSNVSYDTEIADKYMLRNKKVFGFIGSFYKYEGLDLLIESFAEAIWNIEDARLLLVGDGEEKDRLIKKTMSMGLNGKVIFTGKVPHEEIKKYYSVIDVLVYPRKKMRLTDLVTPLKPLEAMAMGKAVIGSDVGGIKELITDGKDGFLFKAEDIDDLSRLMLRITADRDRLQDISRAAIETVHTKHKWESAVKRYLPVYERLLK